MRLLIITYGLPASGKTTWAKSYQMENKNVVRINKDDLRDMLHNGEYTKENEKLVVGIRDLIIKKALAEKKDVIIDDTNLHPTHINNLEKLAKKCRASYMIQDFSHVSVEECIKRDAKRKNKVGEEVIRDMYDRYLNVKSVA